MPSQLIVFHSLGPRKLARILVFALERSERETAQHQGAEEPSACKNNDELGPQIAVPAAAEEAASYFDDTTVATTNHNDDGQSVAPSPLTEVLERGPGLAGEALSSIDKALGSLSPSHLAPETRPSEESIPFLLVDDNAINMKVRSPASNLLGMS